MQDNVGTSTAEMPPSPTETQVDSPQRWGDRVHDLAAFVRRHFWSLSSLAVLVILLYWPVVHFQFINWDDPWYITNNDLIKSWHPANLWRVMTQSVARNYAPLTITTFLVEHTLWGIDPSGYHATNLAIHLFNSLLVFALIRQLRGNTWTAWLVAALFAIHPIQIESVAWVSSRKTLLSSTFMLLCGLSYLRPERNGRDEAWGLLWLVLGLLSKASSVVVPPIVFCYDILIRRKLPSEASGPQVIPSFLCVLLTLMTMESQVTIIGGVRSHLELNKLQIIGVDATLMVRYLRLLVDPRNLSVLYDPPFRGINLQIAAAMLLWGGLTGWLWARRERHPWLAFAWATWLWLLFPVMNFFPITTLMNDRYMYLPCIVVFVVIAEGCRGAAENLFSRWSQTSLQPVLIGFTCLLTGLTVGAFFVRSVDYLPVFRDPRSLWSYVRQKTPTLATVHVQWALTLKDEGHHADALQSLIEARSQHEFTPPDLERIDKMIAEWTSESR